MERDRWTNFRHRHTEKNLRISWIFDENFPRPSDEGIFTTASIRWISLEGENEIERPR